MSILIKGMELPKDCERCELSKTDNAGFFGCSITGNIVLRKREEKRPSWCPLIEVPSAEVEPVKCEDCMTITALKAALEPVKRGKWEGVFCSVCGEEAIAEWNETGGEHVFSPYCPNCGAKMDL